MIIQYLIIYKVLRDLTAIRSSGLSLLGFGFTDKVSSDGLMDFEKIGDSKDIYNNRDKINKGGKRYRDTAKMRIDKENHMIGHIKES